MKITFFSNFLNHHQLPFCLEMYDLIGDNFRFVATEPIHEERLLLGYKDMSSKYSFALNTYISDENFMEGIRLGRESDVVIIGSAPEKFIKERLAENKLTFRYSERLFKKGRWRIFYPKTLISLIKNHTMNNKKKNYLLCASAYTSSDFNLVRAYKQKVLKWGYFPEVKKHNMSDLFSKKKNNVTKLLWVGRLIDWKHPENAMWVAHMLKKNGYIFELDIIGIGNMRQYLEDIIVKYQLGDYVKLLGSMQPEEVRAYMESANIFIYTSDFNEGWGAVLNEAMNSGCAVVASHAIGSVPFLLNHQKNGLIYKNDDNIDLFQNIKYLIDNPQKQREIGELAYHTLFHTWNAKVAADRLLKVSHQLLIGDDINLFDEGPCSSVELLKNNWFRGV